jgi:hypothetical protein
MQKLSRMGTLPFGASLKIPEGEQLPLFKPTLSVHYTRTIPASLQNQLIHFIFHLG